MLAICITLVASAFSVITSAYDAKQNSNTNLSSVYGDINGDGIVDRYDCDALYNYLLGAGTLTEDELLRADINFDGIVDMSDLGIVMDKVSNTEYQGDIDNNKAVDASDLIALKKIILNINTASENELKNCDLNADGVVNVKDLVRLSKYIADKTVSMGG